MDNKLKAAFDSIHADGELKDKTKAYIEKQSHRYTRRGTRRMIFSLAAAACCFLLLSVSAILYFIPTARVSIDINPSIELGINRFDKVVEVSALNEDGKELIEELDIKFADYDSALKKIIDDSKVTELLSQDQVMTITVVKNNDTQSEAIFSAAKQCADAHENVYCHSATGEEAAAAHELGLSCGKYRGYLELKELDPNITPEEVNQMTMHEIRQKIASLSGNNDNSSNNNDSNDQPSQTDHGHHGNGNAHEHNGHD